MLNTDNMCSDICVRRSISTSGSFKRQPCERSDLYLTVTVQMLVESIIINLINTFCVNIRVRFSTVFLRKMQFYSVFCEDSTFGAFARLLRHFDICYCDILVYSKEY